MYQYTHLLHTIQDILGGNIYLNAGLFIAPDLQLRPLFRVPLERFLGDYSINEKIDLEARSFL